MKTVSLTRGKVALVDDADFEAVSKFKWRAAKRGKRIYAVRSLRNPDGKETNPYLHQFLMPGLACIDHRDGDGLNNQRENLRPATHQQNQQGFKRKRLGMTSLFRGVSWHASRKKWVSQIMTGGKHVFFGRFDSETEAARAYDSAARKHFGDFAAPNFPLDLA